MKTIFITGVSSGVGFSLVTKFLQAGFRVIGSVRSSVKASELQGIFGANFKPVIFDITNYWEIDVAADTVKSILGDDHLDGMVNNAGFAEPGPLLHLSLADMRKQFEALVFGQLYVIQKFFRFLVPSHSSGMPPGKIINISSVSGQSSNYFFGCYSAAKHALEGLSKTLREELQIYGVRVIVIAPGNIGTSLWGKQTMECIEKYKDTRYYAQLKTRVAYLNTEVMKNAMNVDEFTERFYRIYTEANPANRYTILKKKLPFVKEKIVVIRK